MDAASAEFHGSRRKTGNGGNGRQLRIGETDMKRKAILGIICFSALVTAVMVCVAVLTAYVDPFFHYHSPRTDEFFYTLDNQRSQNDGIVKHFDYQGIITGTSMVENFKTTEADRLFGCSFIKVPLEGATFRETSDLLRTALAANPDARIVIRGLDINRLGNDKDLMRTDLGDYPTYLYDSNPFNDVNYLFNRDVVFSRVFPMLRDAGNPESRKGITTFDEYSNWMHAEDAAFGRKALYPDGVVRQTPQHREDLLDVNMDRVLENTRQNIIALAQEYPDVTFYCFFTPYSAKWWQQELESERLEMEIEAERIVTREILECGNIRLYSFNSLTDITTDLNNYKDATHYGEWINTLMLQYMCDGKCLLTADNWEAALEAERDFYSGYDYTLMNSQEDYDDDSLAEQLLYEKLYGTPNGPRPDDPA